MKSKLEKWCGYEFSTGISPGEDYLKFQREAKTELRKILLDAGFEMFKFLPNHYEFSCIAKKADEDRYYYISISDVRTFRDKWWNAVLYRAMKDEKDYRGEQNHYCKWGEIGERLIALDAKKR